MPSKNKAVTFTVLKHVWESFQQASRAEGLSYSKCFEIAIECVTTGEIDLPSPLTVSTRTDTCTICLNISPDHIVRVRAQSTELQISQGSVVAWIMAAALKNGLGQPIRKAA